MTFIAIIVNDMGITIPDNLKGAGTIGIIIYNVI